MSEKCHKKICFFSCHIDKHQNNFDYVVYYTLFKQILVVVFEEVHENKTHGKVTVGLRVLTQDKDPGGNLPRLV